MASRKSIHTTPKGWAKPKRGAKSIHSTPKGWGDWNPVGSWLNKAEKTSKGVISEKSLKNAANLGKTLKKTAIEAAIGDPKKGPVSMGINAATWFVPYGKINKGVDLVVGGERVLRAAREAKAAEEGARAITKAITAGTKAMGKKTVRGIAKGAAMYGIDAGTGAIARKSSPRPKGRR